MPSEIGCERVRHVRDGICAVLVGMKGVFFLVEIVVYVLRVVVVGCGLWGRIIYVV